MDFDIAGVENSLMAVSLEVEDKHEPWFEDDWGPVNTAQALSSLKYTDSAGHETTTTGPYDFTPRNHPLLPTQHARRLCDPESKRYKQIQQPQRVYDPSGTSVSIDQPPFKEDREECRVGEESFGCDKEERGGTEE